MARGLDRYELTAITLTAGYNAAVNHHLPLATHLPANLATSAALLGVARRAGVGATDLGLGLEAALPGLRVGSLAGSAAVAGIALGCVLPSTRRLFADARAPDRSGPRLAYEVLLRVPFATALGEELVFRSALLGLFGRGRSRTAAIAISSSLFGLWHVLPTLESLDDSASSSTPAPTHRLARVVGVVGLTAAAGIGFAVLRLRTGSVVAPVIAHAAINASALVAAHLVSRGAPVTRPAGGGIREAAAAAR